MFLMWIEVVLVLATAADSSVGLFPTRFPNLCKEQICNVLAMHKPTN